MVLVQFVMVLSQGGHQQGTSAGIESRKLVASHLWESFPLPFTELALLMAFLDQLGFGSVRTIYVVGANLGGMLEFYLQFRIPSQLVKVSTFPEKNLIFFRKRI
jgi:hypothetical protein